MSYARPSDTPSSWTAGASSITPLTSDGWFSFSVPANVQGVVVALSPDDLTTDPSEVTHGILFARGQFTVIEPGTTSHWYDGLSEPRPYRSSDRFYLVRSGGTVKYYHFPAEADPPTEHQWFHLFALHRSTHLVYTSRRPLQFREVSLDASLLGGGDRVDNTERRTAESLSGAAATLEMAPADVAAFVGEQRGAHTSFPPALVQAGVYPATAVRAAFAPMGATASQDGFASAVVSFPPMEASSHNSQNAAAFCWMALPTVTSGGGPAPVNSARLRFRRPLVFASENDSAGVYASFLPPFLLTWNEDDSRPHGVLLVPRFIGELPEIIQDVGSSAFAVDTALLYRRTVQDVESVAVASVTATPYSDLCVTTSARGRGEALPAASSSAVLADGARALDTVVVGTTSLLSAQALADDWVGATSSAILIGTGIADDLPTVAASGAVSVQSSALASDWLQVISVQDVSSGAVASDEIRAATIALLVSEAIADDQTQARNTSQGTPLLESVALASEETVVTADRWAVLEGEAVAEDELLFKQPGLIAWVFNPDTGAVSWYDNWHFTAMAQVGDKVFAAGPQGLVVLGGDRDGADTIDADVQWGFTEFGGHDKHGRPINDESRKRVTSAVFGYHADAPLQMSVETYGQGLGTYYYRMPPKSARQPTNNRVLVGRGLSSRYWRLGVQNVGGGDFEVHSVGVDVVPSTRRV